jgi:hypothetical protein
MSSVNRHRPPHHSRLMISPWPKVGKRNYGSGHLHDITGSSLQRRPMLGTARRGDLFLEMREQARRSYRFLVVAYAVMLEHVHRLRGEPERGTPSTILQVVKQRFAHRLLRELRKRALPAQKRPCPSQTGPRTTNYQLRTPDDYQLLTTSY